MENNELFRKKSLERISSPEEMHDYMRVTSPRLWMILAAILVMLAGFLVYASTTTLENTLDIRVQVETYDGDDDGSGSGEETRYTMVSAEIPIQYKDSVEIGMELRIGSETGKVIWISTAEDSDTLLAFFQMEHRTLPLPDGEHDAVLVLESTTPISFLWNQ